MDAYFLTGATGVVGSEVLRTILSASNDRVGLLMRRGAGESGQQRLSNLLKRLDIEESLLAARVRVFEGDIEKPDFGLAPDQYNDVVNATTRVVHCAGNVKSNLPVDKARTIGVGSVRSVLRLSREVRERGCLKKVEIVSTVGVAGRDSERCTEGRIDWPREFHNTYEQAKAEAEDIVWDAIDDGMPITLHRPSMIIGNTATGRVFAFQVFYFICEFLSGGRTAGFLPRFGTASLDVVPIDFVANAIVWSSRQHATRGKVLNLSAGSAGSVPLDELIPRVRSAFVRNDRRLPGHKPVPMALFRRLVPLFRFLAPRKDRRRINTLGFFLDYVCEPHDFACAQTDRLLRSAGIIKPDKHDYIDRVLDYYLARQGK